MIYAQFYAYKLDGTLDEAIGDRSVIVIDGRLSNRATACIAEEECRKRQYAAWRLFNGEAFTRSSPISQLTYIHEDKPVRNPVWLSAHD